jgi:hypothetical protein
MLVGGETNFSFRLTLGKLHLDLFCQDKDLLNHVHLKIKLRRSRDAFALVANYKIKIKEMSLYVRKVQLSPAVRMGHMKALEKTSCKYPVRRVEVKVDTVPTGNMNYVQDNMFLGQLPKRLVTACVDSDALNGTIGENPFDFKHYKINFVSLNVEGRQIPAKPSKQGVSFGIIFSRNGISFVLIHFSGTGVESHITSDVAIVFEIGL